MHGNEWKVLGRRVSAFGVCTTNVYMYVRGERERNRQHGDQNEAAKQVISEINVSGKWPGRVTTKISEAGDFWQAEPAHQDYLQRVPNGYTCHYIRPDWVLAKRS